MLKNIHSRYNTRIIFNYLTIVKKLKIIKYNKNLQNILNIRMYNYMLISGKYIKYISKNKVKEYDFNDKRIFLGQYLNGKRNGPGKEFDGPHELLFEGEYLNGKRNGKGKEYYYETKLKFKGEYLNGKRWNGIFYNKDNYKNKYDRSELKDGKGYIKEYDFYGQLIYEGEYLNGERNGKGKEYKYNSMIYEGEYLNGKRHGKGKDYRINKIIFNGEYRDGKKWSGFAYDDNKNLICKFENGTGFIKKYTGFKDILIFEGEFIDGEGNGKVKEYYENVRHSLKYEGEYLNGKRHGKGKEYNEYEELIFEGEYLNNYRLKGKEFLKNRLEYEGDYLSERKWNGKGYDDKGNIIYELINGKGKVKEYNKEGYLIYEGEYLNGKRNGKGKEFNEFSEIIYEGEYLKHKRNGKGIEYDGFDKEEVVYLRGKKISGKNCVIV